MVYPFIPIFSRSLGMSLGTLSVALGLRSLSGVFGPLLASIGDSRGRKAGMLLGLAIFTIGTGLFGLYPTFLTFLVMLFLSLLGNFVFIPAMQAYLSDRVAYERRSQALALTEFGWSLSFIIGVPLAGLLIVRQGLQAPFIILAGLGCLSLAALFFMLPKNQTTGLRNPTLRRNLRLVLTFPPAMAGIAIGTNISASNELINVIFGVWIEDTFSVKIAALAATSAVIGISELGGEALVTGLTDWIGKSRAVGIGLLINILAVLALPYLGRELVGALVGLFLIYLSFEFTIVSSIPLVSEMLPAARATLLSVYIAGLAVGRSLGAFLAPNLYQLGSGIQAITLAAASLDLLALIILWGLVSNMRRNAVT